MTTKNIWAVGRNYIDHAKEMNAEIPTEPLIFLKAGSTLNTNSKIILPKWSEQVHHEIEIALKVDADLNFCAIALAIDLTARDLQAQAKKNGAPWTQSKSFSGACPVSAWIPIKDIENLAKHLSFALLKNNQLVQAAKMTEMIFSAPVILDYIKKYFPLCENDIILTGTPAGVAQLRSGDQIVANLYNTLQQSGTELSPVLSCHWDVE